jgi:hypothetical protein
MKATALEKTVKIDDEGWITLSVTDLLFPPWCSDCGAPTLDRQPFRVHHMTGFALILVPVCATCQTAFRQNYRKAFWKPFALVLLFAAVVGFALGTIPAITGRDPKSFPILALLSACAAALAVFPPAMILIKRRVRNAAPPPVEFRRYVRDQHVTFRFRRPEYAAEVVEFLKAAARSSPK